MYNIAKNPGTFYGGIEWFNGDASGVSVAPGWNKSIGLGSFKGNVLWDGGTTVAGDPQTPSNP